MSILRAHRGKIKDPQGEPALFMAMVALAEPRLPDPQKLSACLLQHWPDKPRFGAFTREEQTLTCDVGTAVGGIGLVPTKIAAGDIQAACSVSLAWSDGEQVLQKHTAHLICSVGGPVQKKAAAFQLTKLVAALTQTTPALGVYWGGATLVHSPETFFEQACEMTEEYLPLYLWLNFGLAGGIGKVSLRTRGMSSLGFMEIEIIESRHSPDEIVGFAFNTAHYLLDHGPILADGHTFGMSAEEKVLIRHLPSVIDSKETVYRLSY